MKTSVALFLSVVLLSLPTQANAQGRFVQFVGGVAKDVAADPTTYGPFGASLVGKKLDWDSSQIFFRNGHYELNPDYTVSGRPNDRAISYGAGNRKLVIRGLSALYWSLGNNGVVSAGERLLLKKYPEHRKLIKTIGWIEKVAANGYIGYYSSRKNFRQWRTNENMARQLGYR